MKIHVILMLLVAFAVAMFLTNPSRADVDAEIQSLLLTKIDGFEPDADQDPVIQLIFTTCKFGRSACVSFIQSLLDVKYEDKYLFSKVTVRLENQEPVICYGALTKVICPKL